MYGEAQTANQEYLSTWKILRMLIINGLSPSQMLKGGLKGNFENGHFVPPKIRAFLLLLWK